MGDPGTLGDPVAATEQSRPVRFIHNTILSFAGLAVPLAVAFALMPVTARNLGPARFGLLALAWAVLEYLVIFDLGLGRTTTRFVAESMGRSGRDVAQIAAISLATQAAMGVIAGAAFALGAPILVGAVFRVEAALHAEAIGMFRVVALSLPVVMILGTMRGVLEGAQRFDLSAAIRIPSSASAIAIPAWGALAGKSLPVILMWVLVARAVTCIVQAVAITRSVPGFRWEVPREWLRLKRLLGFGRWVALSSVVSPLLVYLDRFALGSIVGMVAVGYYTAPYEGVTRLLLIPISLVGALLPAMTRSESVHARAQSNRLVTGSLRNLALVLSPILAIVFVFAPAILGHWLGPDYAERSTIALRFLAAGVLMNALAHPLFIALYAVARPDIPAKLHVAELAVHVPLTLALVSQFGVTGAAAAWFIRVSADTIFLFVAVRRTVGTRFRDLFHGQLSLAIATGASIVAGPLAAAWLAKTSTAMAATVLTLALVHFAWMGWNRLMTATERAALADTAGWYLRRVR